MFHLYKLWSLLDMLRINAKHYVQIGNFLRAVSDNLSARAKFDGMIRDADRMSLDEELPSPEINFLLERIQQLSTHLEALELVISLQILAEIHKNLSEPLVEWTWRKAQIEFEYLSRTIQHELNNRLCFYIPSHRAPFYKSNLLTQDAQKKLPSSVKDDMEKAGDCFATENFTACVFHLMRVMETGVQKLGDSLGVPLTNEKEWQKIINNIRHEINIKYPKNHQNRITWDNLLVKLETVKDAWRNPTMHPKATYEESAAWDIIISVRIFINELANVF
jgi:hypothetical protein